MEMQAEVIGVEQGFVRVKVSGGGGGCGRCSEPGGCNSGVLTQFFGRHLAREFRLENRIGAQVGEQVVVSVADGVTMKTAMVVYLVPVVLVILGAALGTGLGAGDDRIALFGAAVGMILAVGLVAFYRGRSSRDENARPTLARRAEPGVSACSRHP